MASLGMTITRANWRNAPAAITPSTTIPARATSPITRASRRRGRAPTCISPDIATILHRTNGATVARRVARSPSVVQPHPHQRQQLLDVDRLGDVVRGAGGYAALAVALHGLGRQGDDGERRVLVVGADDARGLVAVEARHH